LKHLIKAVKDEGGEIMIFYIPADSEVEKFRRTLSRGNDERVLGEIVKALGEELWSLTPVIAASGEKIENLYFKGDGHWTPLGHALAAQYMAKLIKERLVTLNNLKSQSKEKRG
jgi:hypothetical protein